MVASFREYREFMDRLAAAGDRSDTQLDEACRELCWRWFERKLIVIEDVHATGDQIIARIIEHTPPGLHNCIMDVQNIEGTGLDFGYRWQAWETCHQACEDLRDKDPAVAEGGCVHCPRFRDTACCARSTSGRSPRRSSIRRLHRMNCSRPSWP